MFKAWHLLLLSLALLPVRSNAAPLHLDFVQMEVLEIHSRQAITAYRLRVDGELRQESRLDEKDVRQLWMIVDASQRYTVHVNFANRRHAVLIPDFTGIENQCSGLQRDLPPGQTIDPAGWTSIYRVTIKDPCQQQERSFEIQVR